MIGAQHDRGTVRVGSVGRAGGPYWPPADGIRAVPLAALPSGAFLPVLVTPYGR